MEKKKILVVGAGPGGLSAAMILASKGYDVTVVEKEDNVGGRNAQLTVGEYHFDLGPTFLMMKFVLDEIFELAGEKSEEYLKFVDLDPMYRLDFSDFSFDMTTDHTKMREQIENRFPGQGKQFDLFLKKEKKRFTVMKKCLEQPYTHWWNLLSSDLLKAMPYLSLNKSVYSLLDNYFEPEELKLSFSFQTKYLGMSPWQCPGAFMMLPYIEHKYGVFHVQGGLSEISHAMKKVIEKKGGKIRLKSSVKELIIEKKAAKGVMLESGEEIFADEVVLNADFAYAMSKLVKPKVLKKYSSEKLEKKKYSCSTFMLYLGLSKQYDLAHHTIFFAKDYKKNLNEIFDKEVLSDDASFYVRNSSVTDPHVAPKGKSALYVLVPVPNNFSSIDWNVQKKKLRDHIVSLLKSRAKMHDIEEHIEEEVVIAPNNWESDHNVFKGAIFNLAHSTDQMLYFRPRNKFEELEHCWLVGGGTHPGSGLPTIYESARITSNLIMKKHNTKK